MISEELVGDDRLFLSVPEYGNGHAAGVSRVGARVDLVEEIQSVEAVPGGALLGKKGPAVGAHEMVHDGHGNDVFELLQNAEDQRAVSPRAGVGDVEVIAAGLRLEAAFAAGRGQPLTRDPVAPQRFGPHEAAAGLPGRVPDVMPFSVDQPSHAMPPPLDAAARSR